MRSLYLRYFIRTILIIVLSVALSFLISNIIYHQTVKPINDAKYSEVAIEIAEHIERSENLDLNEFLQVISSLGYQIYVTNEDKEDFFYGDSFRERNLHQDDKAKVLAGQAYHGIMDFPKKTIVTGFFANELKNTVGVPIKYEDSNYALFMRPNIKFLINEMHILLGSMGVFSLIIILVAVLLSAKRIINPITKLKNATQKLSKGNFEITLETKRQDEIGDLSRSFAKMAQDLKKLDEMKNEFVTNVSHDIQTPLANIKGYVNLINNKNISESEQEKYIKIVDDEISRLSELTKQLLLLASLNNYTEVVKKEKFALDQQIRQLIRNYHWLIQEKGLTITYDLGDMVICGDYNLLYQVWENLLTNAIKYNVQAGSINIQADQNADDFLVTFSDTGVGMSEEALGRVFERFNRGDIDKIRTIEGTGLGLSIVKSIVNLHQGKISLKSEKNQGTSIMISLPKKIN